MKLTPIFTSAGQMLGHLNLALCRRNQNSWVVDENAGRVKPYMGDQVSDTVRFFRFPIRRIRFHWYHEEQSIAYVVIDEVIPDWVWKVACVRFGGADDWERQ